MLASIILFVRSLESPGIYWLVAPTYGQAKELAWNILIKMIPDDLLLKKPNETNLCFIFKNGSEIHLKGADNPDSLVGRGLKGIVIDEIARIRNHQRLWEEILRPSLSDYQGWGIFISTPQGKNYFWQLFVKGQKNEDEFKSWQFKTSDNPFIPRSEIKAAQDMMNDRYFRQEYEASFEDYTGLVWPEFSEKDHMIEPFDIPDWYDTFGCIDTAVSGTTAALKMAVDENGNLVICDEYYEQNKRVSEVVSKLKDWKVKSWFIDPASSAKNQVKEGNIYSLHDEYRDYGIYARHAENDVNAGINRVAEFLKSKKIKIFRTCKNLLEEISQYHWSEERETVSGVTVPKPYKEFDHAVDCLRYLVMTRSSESLKPKPRSKDKALPLAIELIEEEDISQYRKLMSR